MSLGSSGNATIRRPHDGCNGAESTVLRLSLSILLTVLGTVMASNDLHNARQTVGRVVAILTRVLSISFQKPVTKLGTERGG
jgi:hypothetical protein